MAVAPTFGAAETMKDAVSKAVTTNPRVNTVSKNRLATDKELEQARAFWRPSVDVVGRVGKEFTNSPTVRGNNKGGETLTRKDATVTLSQLIYDFGATQGEIDRNKARVRGAAMRVAETSEFVALDAIEAYLEVMRHRALVDIARQNILAHERIFGDISARARGGGGTQADVEQALARLELARSSEAQARQALRSAEAHYRAAIGDPPGTLTKPAAHISSLPKFDSLVETVKTRNPTVVALREEIDVARGQLKSADAGYFPKFSAELSGTKGDDLGGIRGRNDSASALLVMRWNLYRGGADQAKIEEFRERILQAESEVREAERAAEREARISWAAMEASEERARSLQAAVAANEQVVRIYRDQFRLGQRTLLDTLDAENELFSTRSNLVSVEYANLFSMYRVLATNGDLLRTLGVALPKEADPKPQ